MSNYIQRATISNVRPHPVRNYIQLAVTSKLTSAHPSCHYSQRANTSNVRCNGTLDVLDRYLCWLVIILHLVAQTQPPPLYHFVPQGETKFSIKLGDRPSQSALNTSFPAFMRQCCQLTPVSRSEASSNSAGFRQPSV